MVVKRRGRPTQAEAQHLQEKLRDAAVATFIEHGYDATTMEAIAQAAGITKRTLYARYPDKRAVFLDVIPWALTRSVSRDESRTGRGRFTQCAPRDRPRCTEARVDPDTMRLHRIAMNVSVRFPEFAVSAETLGWSHRHRQVVELLRHHQEAGTIEVDDIELAAEHFLAMVEVFPARLADFGVYRSRKEQERHLKYAIDLFLRGVLPRDSR